MGAGERRTRGPLADVPLLAAAGARTQRRLAPALERLRLASGATIIEAGRPVHWIAVPVDGELGVDGPHATRRRWVAGSAVHLGEALLHGVAPETVVVTGGPAEVVFVPLPALTAALSTDPALGMAVARSLAEDATLVAPETSAVRRPRRFEQRRLARVSIRPAA